MRPVRINQHNLDNASIPFLKKAIDNYFQSGLAPCQGGNHTTCSTCPVYIDGRCDLTSIAPDDGAPRQETYANTANLFITELEKRGEHYG